MGAVTSGDLEEWLREVEGWGRQHVYLYRGTVPLRDDPLWDSPETVRDRLAGVEFGDAWRSHAAPDFPEELVPGYADYRDGRLEILWRRRRERWVRDRSEDKDPEEIRGYLYEFRAHRLELSRAVMRFVLYPSKFRGALFVQLPLGKAHDEAKEQAEATLRRVFAYHELKPASISRAIKSLDSQELAESEREEHGQVQSQNAKYYAGGATVEFDADPEIVAWKTVDAVRRVRRALETRSFEGVHGRFTVSLRSGAGMKRDIQMSLSGSQDRIYLFSQMDASEVWLVLDTVLQHSR